MYHEQKRGWVKHLDFSILDLFAQELALVLAYFWRFRGAWIFRDDRYIRMMILVALIDIVVIFMAESYSGILRRTKYQEISATFVHCLVVFGGVLAYMYATKQSEVYSRQLLFMYLFLTMIFEYFVRVVWKRRVRRNKLMDRNKSVMIVVADSDTVETCLHEISHNKYTDFKVAGVVVADEDRRGETIQGIPIIASADTFLEYIRQSVVDEVFIDKNIRTSAESLAEALIELGTTVHITLIHTNKLMPNRKLESYANYMVLTTSMKIASFRQVFIKRTMDIAGAIVGLILTGIFTLIFGPIIMIQSPGPIFYQSIRIGRNGRRFKFYKFRTMVVDADKQLEKLKAKNEMQGNMFKMENDPRVIPIGRFMRKYSIDEFPQFWNVLKGDMSLVGTRPPTEEEFAHYEYHHKARLGIRPGLTGMWQSSGRNDVTDFEDVVALDTEYIANWSLGLDVQILLKTVGVVLSGEGSK